ncbi:MAG: D-2-hydroxyacid dehydrogenase [Marinobacter sp.]|nr:D-2-hydroxyacid dehydrogenase [Marinobacter sp.]
MRAVFLDAATLGDDVELAPIAEAVDEWVCHDHTPADQTLARIQGFDTVITNKVRLTAEHFAACPAIRQVAVTATGTNNIDLGAAARAGVRVVNVIRYGRAAVAQHTLMLMLALAGRLLDYHRDVQQGAWGRSRQFCLMDHPIMELEGRTLGIVGYGDLGQGVARLAEAFGMRVLLAARPGQPLQAADGLPRLPLEKLLPQVDVLSLHCLLTPETHHLIGRRELGLMQPHALLLNTSRGGLVDEQALVEALTAGKLAGAGFDVLSEEPPTQGNPLLAEGIPNLIVTPHCAWASREARQRMVSLTAENLREMKAGTLTRWVV